MRLVTSTQLRFLENIINRVIVAIFGTHREGSPVVDYGTDNDFDEDVVQPTKNATDQLRSEIQKETVHVKREQPTSPLARVQINRGNAGAA